MLKRWICALLVLALSGCIPIGFRSQNLPYTGANFAPAVNPPAARA
jgi:predicted aminopeptidase